MPDGAHDHFHLIQEVLAWLVRRSFRIRPGPYALLSNTRELRHQRVRRLHMGFHAAFTNPLGGIALVVNICPAFRAVHEVDAYPMGVLGWHFAVDKSDDRLGPQMTDSICPLGAGLCLIADFGLGLGEEPGQAQGMAVAAMSFCFHLNVTSPQCTLFYIGLVPSCRSLAL